MPDLVLTLREVLPRLVKPLLLLLIAVTVVIGAVFLFDLSSERARAAASAHQPPASAPAEPAASAPTAPAAPAPVVSTPAAPAPAVPAPATQPRAAIPRAPAQSMTNHHVVAGETLATIAVRYNVPAEQLASDNALANPSHIRAGQKLRINPKASDTHVVKPGETLSALANQHGLSLAQLRALNPRISDPNLILAGQQLQLR